MEIVCGLEDISRNVPLFLFGASQGGLIVKQELDKDPDIQLVAFIDNHKTGAFAGKPILSPDQFMETPEQKSGAATILIASHYYQEISVQLRRKGVTRYINAYPLIDGYLKRKARRKTALALAVVAAILALVQWMVFR